MKVSTRSEYGLRALIYLASHGKDRLVSIREIGKAWHIPLKYLEHIFKTLKDAGIIEAQAGAQGGYRLAQNADSIIVGQVIRILDGRLAPMGCVSNYSYEACEFEPLCGLKRLWAKTRLAMLSVLDQTSLAELCTPPGPSLQQP